jgi:FMN-dependent NADH-azoreductase
MNLLHIDSSILGQGSVSRVLSAEIVAALRTSHPDIEVTYRDLAAHPIAHLTAIQLPAIRGGAVPASSTPQDVSAALDEFLAADVVVVGAPMYNFSIPSQLKAWIDRIAVAGKTFRYTEKGPEGLAGAKKLIIASSRGGFVGSDTPFAALDHQESYLRTLFGFLGITNITFVRAEGVALGAAAHENAIKAAKSQMPRLAA